MDMNKTFFLRKEDSAPKWRIIDARGMIVGRLATQIAIALRGKDKAAFTPHSDAGDYVVVINTDKILFTGNKMKDKVYNRYTGYIGNKKFFTAKQIMEKDSTEILRLAVKGMLASNAICRDAMRKLKLYAGEQHPHGAQIAGFAPEIASV